MYNLVDGWTAPRVGEEEERQKKKKKPEATRHQLPHTR